MEEDELKDIRVTFKNNATDKQLRKDITEASLIIGVGAWMKQAAYEKIQRDKAPIQKQNTNAISIADMFK